MICLSPEELLSALDLAGKNARTAKDGQGNVLVWTDIESPVTMIVPFEGGVPEVSAGVDGDFEPGDEHVLRGYRLVSFIRYPVSCSLCQMNT